mgnify:CR=1 FL=1
MILPTLDEYSKKYQHIKFHREDGILQLTLHSEDQDLVWGFAPHQELGYCFADIAAAGTAATRAQLAQITPTLDPDDSINIQFTSGTTGNPKGATLTQVPAQYTTWANWSSQHPQSLLLSRDTGHERNYDQDPYAEYKRLPMVMYATLHSDWRLPAKTWVVGITAGDEAIALPFAELDTLESALRVNVGGQALDVHWDKAAQSARVFDVDGMEHPATAGYWFAWVAFHPTTALYLSEPAD